ncbi:hypothetical protein QFZ43_005158 [Streptomyces afghaniensis]|nr:hypothetical protein [Streptomyces afghaniensis]
MNDEWSLFHGLRRMGNLQSGHAHRCLTDADALVAGAFRKQVHLSARGAGRPVQHVERGSSPPSRTGSATGVHSATPPLPFRVPLIDFSAAGTAPRSWFHTSTGGFRAAENRPLKVIAFQSRGGPFPVQARPNFLARTHRAGTRRSRRPTSTALVMADGWAADIHVAFGDVGDQPVRAAQAERRGARPPAATEEKPTTCPRPWLRKWATAASMVAIAPNRLTSTTARCARSPHRPVPCGSSSRGPRGVLWMSGSSARAGCREGVPGVSESPGDPAPERGRRLNRLRPRHGRGASRRRGARHFTRSPVRVGQFVTRNVASLRAVVVVIGSRRSS